MDVDLWASRVHPAKHISAVHAARLSNSDHHLVMDDKGVVDEDVRAWFPCPFCYVEVELPLLCSHLQEEHCFDLKNAVCPICAANLGRDATGHFTVQHSHSVKRRRKTQKSGFWSNNSTGIGKDLRELSLFLSPYTTGGQFDVQVPETDPLLSPFLSNLSVSDSKDTQKDEVSCNAASSSPKTSGIDEEEEEEENYEENRKRSAFVQELIFSTIF